MTATTKQDLPHFVAINRIMKLPVVSSGVNQATYIYVKVKVGTYRYNNNYSLLVMDKLGKNKKRMQKF